MKACRSGVRRKGFTLVELMVAVAVAAALMTIAVPSFVSFQRNAELTSAVNGLVSSLAAARGEAMKTGMYISVAPADAQGWRSGWVVFVDKDMNQAFTEGVDIPLSSQAALAEYLEVTPAATSTAARKTPYITFDGSGYPKSGSTGAFARVTLSVARTDGNKADAWSRTRRILISPTGRIRSCRPASATDAKCPESEDE